MSSFKYNPSSTITGTICTRLETEDEVVIDWKIDFSCFTNYKSYYKSPSFSWSSIRWELGMIYTDGIQLFLYKLQSEKSLTVGFKFGIRLMDGNTEMRCSLIKNFNGSAGSFGTQELILKPELEDRKHDFLDPLTLSCTIVHLETFMKSQKEKYENLNTLSSDFEVLYKCPKNSDITIIVGDQSYLVHKNILSARSPVFAAMFQHDMEEVNSGIIKIDDCDPVSFKDFLLYLYSGKVENFSSSNICHLYKTADKYNVETLKILCIKYIKTNLSVFDIFEILTLANHFNDAELIFATQEFFNKNALQIIKGDHWERFVKQNFPIANQLLVNMLEKGVFHVPLYWKS